jgi:hemerythrin-like domain-containing protein
MDSIAIIKREHRNLNAVLFTLEGLVNEIEKHGKSVEFNVFHGIVYYLDSFLDRYHHPKETDYLFPAVRAHCPDAGPVLDELGKQHAQGERLLSRLLKALSAYEFLGDAGFEAFRDAVMEYVEFERKHARAEEREVLPLAMETFTPSDWSRIDAAFADNKDPLFGSEPEAEFRELFRTLSDVVPAPYGLGPALKDRE